MRAGRVISSSFSTFRASQNYDENEAYKQALLAFYDTNSPHVSKTILVELINSLKLEYSEYLIIFLISSIL